MGRRFLWERAESVRQDQSKLIRKKCIYMIKLTSEQIETLLPLYNGHFAQELEYVRRGENPFGKVDDAVYADDTDRPNVTLLLGGVSGLYGDATHDGCDGEIKELITNYFSDEIKYIELHLYTPGWEPKLDTLFGVNIAERWTRHIHRLDRGAFTPHPDLRGKTPDGFTLRRYDTTSEEFIRSRSWQDFWHPTSERFGWFLVRDGETVSECSSVWVDRVGPEAGCAEINIETAEPHRGKGYAYLTASAFIDECLSRGLEPVWCCWDFRTESKALAKKLGYRIIESRSVLILCPEKRD